MFRQVCFHRFRTESYGKTLTLSYLLSITIALVYLTATHGNEVYAPAEAFLAGEEQPFFGSVDEWDRRFFQEHIERTYGRRGQRQILDIQEGKAKEAVEYCKRLLARDPHDVESLFSLSIAYCQLDQLEDSWQTTQRALQAGLPLERYLAGPRDLLQPLYLHSAFRRLASDRNVQLIHGPMLGCITDTSASFWLRSARESQVEVKISSTNIPKSWSATGAARTDNVRDYTTIVKVEGLQPDTEYRYSVFIDGQKVFTDERARFRTYGRTGVPARFQLGFGGGALYTPENERIWSEIARRKLDGFLLLGDNVYIDLPQQASPLHRYTYYRRQSRPEFRQLISTTPIYAIWDDHDCATDDCFMGPFVDNPTWKPSLWKLFRNNWNNPGYGFQPEVPGCWFKLQIADVDFFFLDGRYYRTNPLTDDATMLGPVQKEWLFQGLKDSQATFKMIVSPVAFADEAKSALDTWRGYPHERAEIFQFLTDHGITGVVLVSADRHRSDAWLHKRDHDYSLYEFHSSCLTHAKHSFSEIKAKALFAYNDKCSFGLLSFDTTAKDPTVDYEIVNIDGESVNRLTLRRSQLSTRP